MLYDAAERYSAAAPLDSALQSRLEKSLKDSAAAKTGSAVKITNVVNPGVLGGLIVDFGDKSIDMSVQSKVQKMNALMQGTSFSLAKEG